MVGKNMNGEGSHKINALHFLATLKCQWVSEHMTSI